MTPFQHEILKALNDGNPMYSYPTRKRGVMFVWKGHDNIRANVVQALVNQGYLITLIEGGEKSYSLTDAGRAELE